jgi:dCMP deaminase
MSSEFAPLSINPDRIELDEAYMQMAEVWARRSKANRLQVGALIVKDRQIISDGYNGMPAGSEDDVCEIYDESGNIRTKPEVLHAESNALLKIAENGGVGAQGGTLYTTYSPCTECAKLIKQSKIKRVVYRNSYRLADGIHMLQRMGVEVVRLSPTDSQTLPVSSDAGPSGEPETALV